MISPISKVTADRVIVGMMEEANDFVGYVTIPKLESAYIWVVGLQAQEDEPEELIKKMLAKANRKDVGLAVSDLRVEHIHCQLDDLELTDMKGLHKWKEAIEFADAFLEDDAPLLAAWVSRLQADHRWIQPPSQREFEDFKQSGQGPYDSFEDFMRAYLREHEPVAMAFFTYLNLWHYWDVNLASEYLQFRDCYYPLT